MRRTLAAVCLLFFSAVGCSSTPSTTTLATATRTQARVLVRVSLIDQARAGWQLRVVFVPPSPGFHLYSLDLPDGGVRGLGIPTRLNVRGALIEAGTVTADKPTQLLDIAVLDVRLPVYPDGPVTLTLPVHHADGSSAQVLVSYGACSPSTCLAPVIDEAITISVP
jgi:hypothetical protein